MYTFATSKARAGVPVKLRRHELEMHRAFFLGNTQNEMFLEIFLGNKGSWHIRSYLCSRELFQSRVAVCKLLNGNPEHLYLSCACSYLESTVGMCQRHVKDHSSLSLL